MWFIIVKRNAVGAGDEEGLRRGPRGHDAGRGRCRYAGVGRLDGGNQHAGIAQIDILVFHLLVERVVGGRIGRQPGTADVEDVGRQQGAEGHIVAHHADHGGCVVIERGKHALVTIGPGRDPVLQRGGVKGGRQHGASRRRYGIAVENVLLHLIEHGRAGRHACNAIMNAFGLCPLGRARERGGGGTHRQCDGHRGGDQTLAPVKSLHVIHPQVSRNFPGRSLGSESSGLPRRAEMSQTAHVAACRQHTVLRRKDMICRAVWDLRHGHIGCWQTNYVIRARRRARRMQS
jgi:hypothetical protein